MFILISKMKKYISFILLIVILSCSPSLFNAKWTNEIAPETYITRFETSKGNFDVEITRKLSPKAADRFYQLVTHKFFDNGLFYRVNPGFVAQFGAVDYDIVKKWDAQKVADELVIQGNQRGAISFARGGKESRTTAVFINLGDNSRLDTLNYNEVKGFPSFGKVIKGMNVIDSLYSGYADNTMADLDIMYDDKAKFLEKYPQLDAIQKIFILK